MDKVADDKFKSRLYNVNNFLVCSIGRTVIIATQHDPRNMICKKGMPPRSYERLKEWLERQTVRTCIGGDLTSRFVSNRPEEQSGNDTSNG